MRPNLASSPVLRHVRLTACFSRLPAADLFYLDTFPCRRVELVGLLISLDVRENRTTFTRASPPPLSNPAAPPSPGLTALLLRPFAVDDGSSKTLEVVYEHNIFQAFQMAQRLAAARAQQQPSPLPKYRSAYPKRPPPPAALPPYEHTPRVEIGDTVCVRARVKKRSANLQFVVDVDPGACSHPARPARSGSPATVD